MIRLQKCRGWIAMAICAAFVGCSTAWAYPEFRAYVVKVSGRPINCAMCHEHADGPEGGAPGQIGALNPEQIQRLGQARAAFEPGQDVQSPILNAFGNLIIKTVGKKRFLELRSRPEELAGLLDAKSDLDNDGIPDVRELKEGTNALNPSDGNPWLLFITNMRRNSVHIVLIIVATALGMYGLKNLLHAFAPSRPPATADEENRDPVRSIEKK
jgi:hypothetical protein